VTLVVAAVGIVGPHVARLGTFVTESAPELAALFAVGIMSAGIVAAGYRRPWPWLALAAAAPVFATIAWQGSAWTFDRLFWVDLALAPAIAFLLIGLATGRPAPLLRLLDSPPIHGLGSSSYSLYLTHAPIIAIVYELFVAHWLHPGTAAFFVSLAIVLPLTIAFARAFASVFEHGYFQRRRRSAAPAPALGRAAPREGVVAG
jgi:peptidoglycan/LPS O-acetylase OafA/YrhL